MTKRRRPDHASQALHRHGKGMSVRQMLAVDQLCRGESVADVAQNLNIQIATLQKWSRGPQFAKAIKLKLAQLEQDYREARSHGVQATIERLGEIAVKALGTAEECLNGDWGTEDHRERMIVTILDRAGIVKPTKRIDELQRDNSDAVPDRVGGGDAGRGATGEAPDALVRSPRSLHLIEKSSS